MTFYSNMCTVFISLSETEVTEREIIINGFYLVHVCTIFN